MYEPRIEDADVQPGDAPTSFISRSSPRRVHAWLRIFDGSREEASAREPDVMRIAFVLSGVVRTTGRAPRKLLPPGAMLITRAGSSATSKRSTTSAPAR
jgi:hypothetical protein